MSDFKSGSDIIFPIYNPFLAISTIFIEIRQSKQDSNPRARPRPQVKVTSSPAISL